MTDTFRNLVIEMCKAENYELWEASVERPGQDLLWEIVVIKYDEAIAFNCSTDRNAAYGGVYTRLGGMPIRKETRIV